MGTEHAPDPYYLRAHILAPIHGIKHYGALLQPPSWKVGHAPIQKFQAVVLYREVRVKAPKRPNLMTNETANLGTGEQDIQESAEEWRRQLEIDRLIYAERVMIHSV